MSVKILVVDDEMQIRELLRHKLVRAGFEVVTAKSGQEFIQCALIQKPDLIILDIWLEKALGPDVYQELLAQGFNKEVPVIFITALVEGHSGNEGIISERKYSLFSKPFDFAKLLKEVHTLLHLETKEKQIK